MKLTTSQQVKINKPGSMHHNRTGTFNSYRKSGNETFASVHVHHPCGRSSNWLFKPSEVSPE